MRCLGLAAAALCLPGPVHAAGDPALAKDVLMKSIAFRTVEGAGEVPRLAAYYASLLQAAGFAAGDIAITPVGETAMLALSWRGSDPALKPLLLSGHMDVVAANRADWTRDPFLPVEDGGFIYGRGAEDNKYDVAMMVTTLAGLKRAGWQPRRTVILLLSGDEETKMATTKALAEKYADAELLLNGDAGGGWLNEAGDPVLFQVQAGEKTYADFEIGFTDPGGHSSAPTPGNPINRMAQAIGRIAAHRFAPMSNELTRASLHMTADRVGGTLGEAMRRFASTGDAADAAMLSDHPEFVGQVRTTCVATMVQGGHALNALPQSAKVSVNCRIFPGVAIDSVQQELIRVIADPGARVTTLDDPLGSEASPLRADVMSAVEMAVNARYPGLGIMPSMSAGATDSVHFRAKGLPCYGVSSLFQRAEDSFAHGLDERVPVAGIAGALDQWEMIVKALAR